MEPRLKEANDFYKDRIIGWMISDLHRSSDAGTNYLTALGSLVYTEVVGTFLPPLSEERYKKKAEKRFYRCLFRFPSGQILKHIDDFIYKETGTSLYGHLRNRMTHKYYPAIASKRGDVTLYIPIVISQGVKIKDELGDRFISPFAFDQQGRFWINIKNYVAELEECVDNAMKLTFDEEIQEYTRAAMEGADVLFREKP